MSAERDEVLWRFAQETGAAPDRVPEWARRYPEHADAILAMSLYRDVIPEATAEEKLEFGEAVAFQRSAGTTARAMLSAMRARRSAGSLRSIVDTARERGIAPRELSKLLRIGMSVLTRLERRLLQPETVPMALVRSIGNAVGASAETVMAYLRQPPTLSAAASYHARSKVRLRVTEADAAGIGYAALRLLRSGPASERLEEGLVSDDSQAARGDASDVESENAEPAGDAVADGVPRLDFETAIRDAADMADPDKAVWLDPRNRETEPE